jgi:flagellar L-ring protein precursor FlgH
MAELRLVVKIFSVFFVICFVGCSNNLYMKADNPVMPAPQEIVKKPQPGTIWAGENTNNSLFADRRARRINDIITITVSESAVGGNNATTDTSRDTSTTAGISSLLGLEQSIMERNSKIGSSINLGGTSSNSLKGTGATSRDGSLTATLSARVMDVLDNGNFVIEGRRQLTINAEDQYLILTGIIRPDDIASDNTIASSYIADAKIVYTGKGVVDDKMRPGWLTRVVDWVWPF